MVLIAAIAAPLLVSIEIRRVAEEGKGIRLGSAIAAPEP